MRAVVANGEEDRPQQRQVEPKVKMMEYEKEDAKGKGKGREKTAEEDRGERQKVVKCKFYLTPEGCRKGVIASSLTLKKTEKGDATSVVRKNTWLLHVHEREQVRDRLRSRRAQKLKKE